MKQYILLIESHPLITGLVVLFISGVILIFKNFFHSKLEKFRQKRLFNICQKITKADIQNGIAFWQIKWDVKNNTNQDIILTPEHYKQNANIKRAPNEQVTVDEYDKFYIYKLGQYRIPANEELSLQFYIKYKIKRKDFKPPTLLMWKGDFESLLKIKIPLKLGRKRWGGVRKRRS